MRTMILLMKAHIKGYLRSDGTFVADHDDKRAPKKPPMITALLGAKHSGGSTSKAKPAPKAYHPKLNDNGEKVPLYQPHTDGDPGAWQDPDQVARVTPGGHMPSSINGIPFAPWADAPKTLAGWENVPGQLDDLEEPHMHVGLNMHASAGVVVEESDGRVWVIHPSNAFGGYKATFPKGTIEDDQDLAPQAAAIKEAFEESGLQVEITGYLMDVPRTTSVCRYYRARRIGGTPADCGWESQAVSLVPKAKLYDVLSKDVDHPLAELVGAGAKPKKKDPPPSSGWGKPFSTSASAAKNPSAPTKKPVLQPAPFGTKKQGSLF